MYDLKDESTCPGRKEGYSYPRFTNQQQEQSLLCVLLWTKQTEEKERKRGMGAMRGKEKARDGKIVGERETEKESEGRERERERK